MQARRTLPPVCATLLCAALIASGVVVSLPLGDAHAQSLSGGVLATGDPGALHVSTLSCASGGGTWSNSTLTCSVTTLPTGIGFAVQSGASLVVSNGGTLYTIENQGGTVSLTGGAFTIVASGKLENSGLNGACGTISIGPGATVSNQGMIDNTCGTITNQGTITNNANALISAVDGKFVNSGTINNMFNAAMQDDNAGSGMLSNTGTINNAGFFQLYSGHTVSFTGPSTFSGSFTNTGTFNWSPGGTLTVGYAGIPTVLQITQGNLSIPSRGTLYVSTSGKLQLAPSTFVNNDAGYITLQAGPDNSGNKGGMIANLGSIENHKGGTITIGANATNPDAAYTGDNQAGALLLTYGSTGAVVNQAGATINNIIGGRIVDKFDGYLDDYGSFINAGSFLTNSTEFHTCPPVKSAFESGCSPATVYSGGTYTNSGTAKVDGFGLEVYGTATNSAAGSMNSSNISIMTGGAFTNSGLLTSHGYSALNIYQGGVLTNNNGATLNNLGDVEMHSGGKLTNLGSITNTGSIQVDDAIQPNPCGTFQNNAGGTVTNNQGGKIYAAGGFYNAGGTITNNAGGLLTNGDRAGDALGGSFYNNGRITNTGSLQIQLGGDFANGGEGGGGTISNNAGGTITVTSTLKNGAQGSINNGNGATIDIADSHGFGSLFNVRGLVSNSGIIMINSGGDLENLATLGNSGTISNCGGKYATELGGTFTGNPITTCASSSTSSSTATSSSTSSVTSSVSTISTTTNYGAYINYDIAPVTSPSTGMRLPYSGTSISISGISSSNGLAFSQGETGQPPGTGTVSLGGASDGALQFFDIALFGVSEGTAHVCISNANVVSTTTIEYWGGGAWTEAGGMTSASGTVCGDIPASALSGTPVVINVAPSAANTTSSSTSAAVPEFPISAIAPILATLLVISLAVRKGLSRETQT